METKILVPLTPKPRTNTKEMMTVKEVKNTIKNYIDRYGESEFIDYYGDWSTVINSILRDGYKETVKKWGHLEGHYAPKEQLKILKMGLKMIRDKKTIVFDKDIYLYRTVGDSKVPLTLILNDKGFKSTSYTTNIRGCEDGTSVFKILAPKGTRVFPIDYNDDELVLLPQYKLKLVKKTNNVTFKSTWKQSTNWWGVQRRRSCSVTLFDVIVTEISAPPPSWTAN